MQSLNVLIIADESSKALKAVLKSKYLNKLFTNLRLQVLLTSDLILLKNWLKNANL